MRKCKFCERDMTGEAPDTVLCARRDGDACEAQRGIRRPGAGARPRRAMPSEPLPRRGEFARGARHAADIAEGYDASSAHEYRLGDCILAKMNLRDDSPRRNKRRLELPRDAWTRGMATALVGMLRLLVGGGDASGVRRVAADAALYLDDLHDAGVSPADIRDLRRAGVPARRRS